MNLTVMSTLPLLAPTWYNILVCPIELVGKAWLNATILALLHSDWYFNSCSPPSFLNNQSFGKIWYLTPRNPLPIPCRHLDWFVCMKSEGSSFPLSLNSSFDSPFHYTNRQTSTHYLWLFVLWSNGKQIYLLPSSKRSKIRPSLECRLCPNACC